MFNKCKYHKGFTLVELLVVVLIIGILAAVALPMYQKAVERSRSAQAFTLLDSMAKATYTYMMTNPAGEPPNSFSELSVTPPNWTEHTKWVAGDVVKDTLSNGDWSLQLASGMMRDPFHPDEPARPSAVIWVGRISGPYAGAGFIKRISKDGITKIGCMEQHGGSGGISMTLPVGDFCAKVWDGDMGVFSAVDTSTGIVMNFSPIPGL